MNPPTVGIVGVGFVGGAVLNCFRKTIPVLAYDLKTGLRSHFRHETVYLIRPCEKDEIARCSVIFVCVPTPMKADGTHDSSIVDSVVGEIARYERDNLIVIKSTVVPGTTDYLAQKYPKLRFCFNPEFLREKTANEDFENQQRVILGASVPIPELEAVYGITNPSARQIKRPPAMAEMLKYFTNCFLSVKVAFCNEMYEICRETGIDYDAVKALLDDRMGPSHLDVPGHDGRFGFGGTCFPKDLNAMIWYAEAVGVNPRVMRAAWKKNLEVRPERDWES